MFNQLAKACFLFGNDNIKQYCKYGTPIARTVLRFDVPVKKHQNAVKDAGFLF